MRAIERSQFSFEKSTMRMTLGLRGWITSMSTNPTTWRLRHLHDLQCPRKVLYFWSTSSLWCAARLTRPPSIRRILQIMKTLIRCWVRESWKWWLFTRNFSFYWTPKLKHESKSLFMTLIKCSWGLVRVSFGSWDHNEHDGATQRPESTLVEHPPLKAFSYLHNFRGPRMSVADTNGPVTKCSECHKENHWCSDSVPNLTEWKNAGRASSIGPCCKVITLWLRVICTLLESIEKRVQSA